jgi:hypothetical protein
VPRQHLALPAGVNATKNQNGFVHTSAGAPNMRMLGRHRKKKNFEKKKGLPTLKWHQWSKMKKRNLQAETTLSAHQKKNKNKKKIKPLRPPRKVIDTITTPGWTMHIPSTTKCEQSQDARRWVHWHKALAKWNLHVNALPLQRVFWWKLRIIRNRLHHWGDLMEKSGLTMMGPMVQWL